MRRGVCILGALLAVVPGPLFPQSTQSSSPAPGPEFTPSFELRLRWEGFETPSNDVRRDESYGFPMARLRVGGDLKWPQVTLHGVLQGAAIANLPDDAVFGAGQAYFAANDGDADPSQVGIAELSAAFRPGTFQIVAGRQPWNDGLETMTGLEYLDGVKRRRIGDRLIGVWDWPNAGRRYDGVSFNGALAQTAQLAGFAFRPLAGGTNLQDAFEQLDDVAVYGLSTTGKHGAWIPASELRLFAIRYDDERRGALQAAGGELGITTLGGHLLVGDDRNDLLLWAVVQSGDWGRTGQDAWAWIVEAGHEFRPGGRKLAARAGVAQASGDDPGTSEHESFFNLLPTNHKFYGAMDYFAFSNLRNVYAELLLTAGPRWNVRLGADLFALAERGDAWYAGSGPFDEAPLGYAGRRPAGGFRDRELGTEFDVDVNITLRKDLRLAIGGGIFSGGDAAREVFPVEQDGSWVYTQLVWAR